MDADEKPLERRRSARKSVAFTEEKVVVNPDGSIDTIITNDEGKDTAQSHTARTPPLVTALEAFTDPLQNASAVDVGEPTSDEAAVDGPADDLVADDLDPSLKKKKKKAKKTEDKDDEAEDVGDEAPAGGDDAGLDLTLKKKKKKPKKVEDDFAKKLEALDLDGKEAGGEAVKDGEDQEQGDMDQGTGIWAHDEDRPISYAQLLPRFYALLAERNPEHAAGASKLYKIPPPQCLREGPKKTIFANIAEICKRMKRTEEHVTAYLFAELGTSGSTDGSRRLVIKGRFQSKQIENVLRKYIIDYVTCKTCRSPDTELSKGENRLYFITCQSCGSRRSVQAIKTGFSAQVGKRKKMRA